MIHRMKLVLRLIISKEQSGFVPRRSIVEGTIIVHEAIPTIRKSKVDRMLIKLDTRKAYDMVDRSFWVKFMKCIGFVEKWINWVKAFIDGP